MTFCQILVKGVIKIAQDPSAVLWSMIEQHKNKTKVNQGKHADDSPESLDWMEEVKSIWFQVRIATKE
jgi:hypothetical protein